MTALTIINDAHHGDYGSADDDDDDDYDGDAVKGDDWKACVSTRFPHGA